MPPGGMPVPPQTPAAQKNAGRTCLTVGLGVVGVLALLGGGGLTAHAFSNHSQTIPNRSAYGPAMWRNEPADTLFPETLSVRENAQSQSTDRTRAMWHRIGISEKSGCDEGLAGATAAEAKKLGCKAVLRATYVDPTGNTVATAGLIVFPKGDAAKTEMSTFFDAEKDKRNPLPGVKAYAVPGTAGARWSDQHSNGSAGRSVTELSIPCAVVASAGAVDGRKAGPLPGQWGGSSLDAKQDRAPWRGAADSLAGALDQHLGALLLEETS
ncbi:hypothetical protein JK363_11950 [Streptomyces sp. 205]|uniref:Sensor domain-containing protein n=2 Tax=Streptomyces coffeae TaxID=621382 RepID=A0ABS1NC09_9ACTN|nr:hypothetical protein [Streptomyces coffeae]